MNTRRRPPQEVHTRVKRAAEEDGNSVTSEAATAIEDCLERRQTERVREIAREIARRDAELLDLLAQ
ncbi:Arc family DNA-binding protein [Spiractinospora alimapuensis]|uniref:Arc family DNA-binding protein n=1 Tax=Spiractinospora alimapuensis TaxID=2820884 RepID=UPI001F2775FE|nr:Arc family DNA-binding protein [Spiractinospora alimapuensis]QVQ50404.1 Arc family DNA-binding protein [Spiractinospora alimapuensis]